MIYGSMNVDGKTQHSYLLSIKENLAWDNCVSVCFSCDSFYGVFTTDVRLPDRKNEIFYHDKDNDIVVFIDGYIYNQADISLRLSSTYMNFTLAELVAKAYINWGPSFANQLNGDFAICIYQIKIRQVTFFRDHLGIRPLAISRLGSAVYFATDAMGLCKALFEQEKIDPDFMLNYFLIVGYDYTILPNKKIFKLKPGHYLQISKDCQKLERYWTPEKILIDKKLTRPQIFEELKLILIDAVKIRADQSFYASAHISGGLDSSIVASLLRKEFIGQQDFYGFSWSPELALESGKITFDERLLVEKVCSLNNIIPVYSNINADDFMVFWSDWRHSSELLYERKIVEAAKTKGINLIFSGWGGDEFISISNRGIDPDLIRQFNWKDFLKKYPPRHLKTFLRELMYNIFFPSARATWTKYKASKAIYPYIRKALGSNWIPGRDRFRFTSRRDVHLSLISLNHLAKRTADWYVLGQRNGIEYRYPLLDKRIVEYMLKVPSRCLVDGNKDRIILRELGKGFLPEEVLNNISKDDPVRFNMIKSVAKSIEEKVIYEFEVYRNNPDLSFVDFKLLEGCLPEILASGSKKESHKYSDICFCLKSAHEFTKGFYGTEVPEEMIKIKQIKYNKNEGLPAQE
jgi:asparagine synthase (glutamine-hydrolysing)